MVWFAGKKAAFVQELEMKEHRRTFLLVVTVVLLTTTVLMARIKRTEQTPAPEHQFLVSLRPEDIQSKPVFEGIEMAVLGDLNKVFRASMAFFEINYGCPCVLACIYSENPWISNFYRIFLINKTSNS